MDSDSIAITTGQGGQLFVGIEEGKENIEIYRI